MESCMRLKFDSSIENISDLNESFSSGVLKICYTGANRNGSYISKESIERAIPTMYNCPVVCNYDVETDTIGGHDMDIVATEDGDMRLIYLTDAVGVIPESAKVWWSTVKECGTEHEYLMTEVILWKRSPAYSKIANDGVVSQSMEISVKSGQMKDSMFAIDDFIFTAFCLLGDDVNPCFESASLHMFEMNGIKQQFALLMQELKEAFTSIQPSNEVVINKQINSEGGEEALEQKIALVAEFNLKVEDLSFDLEEFSLEEIREKLEAMTSADPEPTPEPAVDFALAEQFREELIRALDTETIETCFGEMSRYWYYDYDGELSEVYCYDVEDWNLYGLPYSMNGDNVVVDFMSKKRKKFSIVDFDEGEQKAVFASVFELAANKFDELVKNNAELEQKYQIASDTISSMENELGNLRQFKTDTEAAIMKGSKDNVFAQFEDLVGVEAFEKLRENCDNYSLDELEEKCYAIRGRNGTVAKFSYEPKAPKLPVETGVKTDPYNGVFAEYGISPNKN